MSILITGGAGFIGSITSAALLDAGYDIVILDNLSNADADVIRRIKKITGRTFPFYAVDILHKPGLARVFENEKIDAVIHFAGLKSPPESVSHPVMYYNNNITGTLNLIDTMHRHNCCNIVFSSSATVYAKNDDPPFKEDNAKGAINPYGESKFVIENILRDVYISDNKWRIALLRYFNPIGAHKSGLLGDDPAGIPNNLLPYIQRVAAGILPFVKVTGTDFDTPDGTGIRDYIHVSDLADGHIAAYEFISKNTGCHTVNLGTGVGSSVFEVITAFEKANNIKIPYEINPRRPGDAAVSYADVSKAKQLLGWEAKLTLEDMCTDAWNFMQNSAM